MTLADNQADLVTNFPGVSFSTGVKDCTFPFRHNDILYYACTNLTVDDTGPWFVCATEIDLDFNVVKMGECDMDNRCPSQREYSSS